MTMKRLTIVCALCLVTTLVLAQRITRHYDNVSMSNVAVGTGTWGIAAVIPKYLALRLQPERFGPLYPRKLAFTINLMLKTTKNILNLENFP